ncbi:hypothetical protein GCM10011506_18830 [Marivirga lumbricoides]|uniref:Uncharacterized protein n=1 Tax=Marivirga lumbricoides TaxID=1046115 RepID=A0ABQ1M1P7_9BACT|nr:hypothetical protein GCM10011506_18830 [Marivirga lumbricoides]
MGFCRPYIIINAPRTAIPTNKVILLFKPTGVDKINKIIPQTNDTLFKNKNAVPGTILSLVLENHRESV